MSVQDTIRDQVTKHRVVLYMKGTPQFPQCGFSSAATQMLKACGVDDFFSVNVLADPEIRQGIKDFANWPTIPQLYVDRRIRRRQRHHARDVRVRRIGAAPRQAGGLKRPRPASACTARAHRARDIPGNALAPRERVLDRIRGTRAS